MSAFDAKVENQAAPGVQAGAQEDTLALLAADPSSNGVLLLQNDGRIAALNRQLEAQFGYSRQQLVGQFFDILLPESFRRSQGVDRAFLAQREARSMATDGTLSGRRRNGSRFPVRLTLRPIQIAGQGFLLAIIEDRSNAMRTIPPVPIERRIEFEKLVAKLCVNFINLPADRVYASIEHALMGIGEALDLDRCSFYRLQPDGTVVDAVSWARSGFPPMPSPISADQRFPWALEKVRAGEVVCFSNLDEVPDPVDREGYRALGIQSTVTVPLSVGGRILGAISFNLLQEPRSWHPDTVRRLAAIGAAFGTVLARQESDEALRQALAEVERLRDQLQAENVYLRREVQNRLGTNSIVGESAAIRSVLQQVEQVAVTDSTVLLLGETGTGKELFATRIHELSGRGARPIVRVNCAAIPATLIESELFGRERGAFTGALARQAGRFELADQSTIFLDEIGDLPAEVQVKLLRVLEERQFERLGSPKAIRVDTRILAATHRDLEQLMARGAFREDLFYRLNVFPIRIPPLRERVEDIPLLVWRFVAEFSQAFGKRIDAISPDNMAALQRYGWPGNIRELRNTVERAMIVASGPRLTIAVPTPNAAAARHSAKLTDVEKEHIRNILESTRWRIRGAGGAAEKLGLRPTTLETRMAKLGLARPKR
jgi:formate hydrogenlyase transcriptional activator